MEKTRFGWWREASNVKKALIIVSGLAIVGGIGYCAYRWRKGKKAEKPVEKPAEQK